MRSAKACAAPACRKVDRVVACVFASTLRHEVQGDGRIRYWDRVVALAVGETIHNAFYDRDFREDAP